MTAPLAAQTGSTDHTPEHDLRPPAVPLILHDPMFSVWSRGDTLNGVGTTHWTGQPNTLAGELIVDGTSYRIIGDQGGEAMEQTAVRVLPTRTIYEFASDDVELTLTFLTPALPADIDRLSTPVSAVVWDVRSADGEEHEVSATFSADESLVRNERDQEVEASEVEGGGDVHLVRMGRTEQPVLRQKGDQIRINWGYLYLGGGEHVTLAANGGGDSASLNAEIDFGKVGEDGVQRHLLVGYDDTGSINYMDQHLTGYWTRDGSTIEDEFAEFEANFDSLAERSATFDKELMESMVDKRGEKFALLAALSHRQSLAACKIVADENGMPLMFSKENASNGCMATVDVFYPQIPHLLLLNNDLAKATVVPILDYVKGGRFPFPFAPHDLGTYPHATGQVYGGGETGEENQMPVEESGNMLIICAAISRIDGNTDFIDKYWPQLTQWVEFLEREGIDPGNQLSTDDFSGHLARNTNLSIKAIMGMAGYAEMAEMRGETDVAEKYRKAAKDGAAWWMEHADLGDHYALTFDDKEEDKDTWSQKYNLVWDQIMGWDIFPDEVVETELAYYEGKLNDFGLPLDQRADFTKGDWELWTATLADDAEQFDMIVDRVFKFADETPDRIPFTDWYFTSNGKFRGFIARPVIGGLFMPMLKGGDTWKSWAGKAEAIEGEWAPMPRRLEYTVVLPTSQEEPQTYRYTFDRPQGDWQAADFDDGDWQEGPGGFGSRGTPNAHIGTEWNSRRIWLRRDIEIPADMAEDVRMFIHHDEDVEMFLDGQPFFQAGGFTANYSGYELPSEARSMLTPGKHTIALTVRQTVGGQYIDFGFATASRPEADE